MMTSLVSTNANWRHLTGNQAPLYLLADEGDYTEADKCIEFARRIYPKRPLMPWQEALMRSLLAVNDEDRYCHPLAAVVVPRQGGKSFVAELIIAYSLFGGKRVIYTAQRWSTASSVFRRVDRLIESRPSLKRRVIRRICSQGHAVLELEGGASAQFITRSLDAGRGESEVDVTFYDEALALKESEIAALSPTQLASKNPMTIYLSSPVNEEMHANGYVLTGIRQRALDAIANGDTGTGLLYAEFGAPPPPDDCSDAERRGIREDVATWEAASPSWGIIQDEPKMRKLLIELGPKSFECECLGWGLWPKLGDGAQRAIDPAVWNALADMSPELVDPYRCVVAVDRSPRSGVYVIAQAIRTQSGGTHVEIGYMDKASPAEVVAALTDVTREPDPSEILISAQSTANVLLPHLTDLIDPTVLNTSESAIAAEAFVAAVDAGQVSHSGQQVLDNSVLAGVKKPLSGGRFTWDCAPGGMITALVAASMAHYGALLQVPKVPKKSLPPMFDSPDDGESYMTRPF
jgi:hypothetical protein